MAKTQTFCLSDIYTIKNPDELSLQHLADIGFSPAYTVTNEDLRAETALTAENARRILTVAASGDQALFYLLSGAEHIETFDITYAAKVIQEIKFAAIRQQMSYSDYIHILENIQHVNKIIDIEPVKYLLHDISPDVAQFLRKQPIQLQYCNGMSSRNPYIQ